MQLIYLKKSYLLLSFFIIWPILQITMNLICNKINQKYFEKDFLIPKTRKWEENGNVYRQVLKINKWKRFLPDGANVYKKGFQKKHVNNYSSEYFSQFIKETRKAEFSHWLQIIPFWIFMFWSPPFIVFIMFLYAIIVNLPCIIAQRYNRPRLIKIYKLILKKELKSNKS